MNRSDPATPPPVDPNLEQRLVYRPVGIDAVTSIAAYGIIYMLAIPTSVLVARAMGPEGKGVLALSAALVAQISLISLGVENALVHKAGRRESSLSELARSALQIAMVVGPIGTLLGWLLVSTIFSDVVSSRLRPSIFIYMLAIPILIVSGYLQSLFVASGRLREVVTIGAVLATLFFLSSGAAFIFGFSVSGLLLLNLLSVASIALLVARLSYRYGVLPGARVSRGSDLRRSLISYGLRGHVGSVIHGVNSRLDVMMVGLLLSTAQLGIYSVAIAAAETLLLMPTIIGSIILQRAATFDESAAAEFTSTATRLTVAAMVLGGGLWIAFGEPVIRAMFGSAFTGATKPLFVMLPGIVALGVWRNLSSDLVGRGYPEAKSYSAAASLLMSVVLTIVLVPRWELVGAAAASSISYGVGLAIILIFYCLRTRVPLRKLVIVERSDLRIALDAVVESGRGIGRRIDRLRSRRDR